MLSPRVRAFGLVLSALVLLLVTQSPSPIPAAGAGARPTLAKRVGAPAASTPVYAPLRRASLDGPGALIVLAAPCQSNGVGGFFENNPKSYISGAPGVFVLGPDGTPIPAREPLPCPKDVLRGSGFAQQPFMVERGHASVLLFANAVAGQLLPIAPPGSAVLIVQACVSAVGFIGHVAGVDDWWKSTGPFTGGQAYTHAAARLRTALNSTNGGAWDPRNNRLVAIYAQLGETDASAGQTAAGFKQELRNAARNLRAVAAASPGGVAAAAPAALLVGGMVPDIVELGAYRTAAQVAAGGADVAGSVYGDAVPFSVFVGTKGIPPTGDVHFSEAGHDELGKRLAAAFARLYEEEGAR